MKNIFGIDTFANPEAFLLLLLVPAFIIWYIRYYESKRLKVHLSYDPEKLQPTRLSWTFLRFVPLVLQLLAFILAILALARPQTAKEVIEKHTNGIDIMLLLDTSGSMETEDFPPNRLDVAKERAEAFVEGRENDRIGVILFAEDAFSYVPLTLDYQLIKTMIREIDFGKLPKQGTAIGSAIATGINRMRDSKSPSKVMILLTDGANNRGQIDPITAARLANLYQIKIYCIGIGKKVFQQEGENGLQTLRSDLDEESLQQIAEITAARFFRSTNSKSLEKIFEQISQMETSEIIEDNYRDITDYYPFLLKSSIILFLLSYIFMLSPFYNPLEQ